MGNCQDKRYGDNKQNPYGKSDFNNVYKYDRKAGSFLMHEYLLIYYYFKFNFK